TVFFSSHLVDEVESIATHVGIVQAGRIRVEGRVAALRRRVRRIVGAESNEPLPSGFERVRDGVWHAADPDVWAALEQSDAVTVEPLSLHEIFLAFARTDPGLSAAA